jgi:hypothetical protein
MAQGFAPPRLPLNCWQEEGYWHIARAQVHSRKYGNDEFFNNDMANNLKTGHMDLTFQPTFYATPHRDFNNQNGVGSTVNFAGGFVPPGMPPAVFIAPAPRNVFNFIGSREEDETKKREWRQTLSLEMDGGSGMAETTTVSHRVLEDSKRARNEESESVARLSAYLSTPLASAPGSTNDTGNGGLLDSLREMGTPFESSTTTATTLSEDSSSSQSVFSVPKPGIKNVKRPPIRGKGVISAVLGADGSVTHEQSRML